MVDLSPSSGVKPRQETSRFWDPLLQFIEAGLVIPVVGQDLLVLDLGAGPVQLYPLLAERLADYLGLSAEGLPAVGALHRVACQHLAGDGDRDLEELYSALKTVFSQLGPLPTPEPLRQLAAIRPLKLFVTTTFDPLMEQALNQVRFGGQGKTKVLAYRPSEVQDLEQPLKDLDRPTVYHLFGRLSLMPDYAVTDEDTLELVHHLQSDSRRPELLFDELSRQQLLLIGSNFPDWLSRFFIRIAKRERLWLARGKQDIIADARVRDDPHLVEFLHRFSPPTKVFSGSGVEFVAELSRRWTERHPEPAPGEAPAATRLSSSADMRPGAVFLSYASEDRARVEALRDELERAGLDVWFDRQELRPGDPYTPKIMRNIDECCAFVPVLSRQVLTSRARYFRLEWDHAVKVAVQLPPSRRFIVPVVLDDTPPNSEDLPERFRLANWQRWEGGPCPGDLVAVLLDLDARFRAEREGTP